MKGPQGVQLDYLKKVVWVLVVEWFVLGLSRCCCFDCFILCVCVFVDWLFWVVVLFFWLLFFLGVFVVVVLL